MKAVILAGGKGTRLAPYTTVFPKPLVPLGNKPILDIIVQQLSHYGFHDIIMSVGYLSELIQAYFQNCEARFQDVNFTYIKEQEPTGTAGSLGLISGLDETFLVINGDILTSIDYLELMAYHKSMGGVLTIGIYKKKIKIDLGVVEVDQKGMVTSYLEKPEKTYNVSMGVCAYEPRVLGLIEPNMYLDFPDLVHRLIDSGEKVVGFPFEGYWLDIGRHEDYVTAQDEFELRKDIFLPDCKD